LRQITNVIFDQTKCLLSYGSADNAIVKFTTVVHLLPVHVLEDTYVASQLHHHLHSGPYRAKRPANTSSVLCQYCASTTDALVAGCRPISCNWSD